MSLRDYIQTLQAHEKMVTVTEPISSTYETGAVLKKMEPSPVLFENVKESGFRVMGNLFCTKFDFAAYFGIQVHDIIQTMAQAIEKRAPCEIVKSGPCQEVVITNPDLDQYPILFHFPGDRSANLRVPA